MWDFQEGGVPSWERPVPAGGSSSDCVIRPSRDKRVVGNGRNGVMGQSHLMHFRGSA